jgi:hypothetical protein
VRSGIGQVLAENDYPHYIRYKDSSSKYCGLVKHGPIVDSLQEIIFTQKEMG